MNMQMIGVFLISFGVLSGLYEMGVHLTKSAKWKELKSMSGGKRYSPDGPRKDKVTRFGQRFLSMLPRNKQEKLSGLLIWSGVDPQGRVEPFLGISVLTGLAGLGTSTFTVIAAARFHSWMMFAAGVLLSLILFMSPLIAIYVSRVKRADQILRDMPLFIVSIKRELMRDANYIESFRRVEKELQGVLKEEIKLLNEYVRSTRGDLRSALDRLKTRCGHKVMDLFCMTIIQGLDTDRVADGLTELDIQMSGMLRDRIQKQTEKRNLMVFFGTLAAASILLLQGSFYGLMKFKEQIGSLPFL